MNAFEPQDFLAKVGVGKEISEFRENEIVFSQGDAADKVFYIQKGNVKLTAISDQGKEAVVAILKAGPAAAGEAAGSGVGRRGAACSEHALLSGPI